MKLKVVKKGDLLTEPPENLSSFQIGQARVKSQNAIKQLEFYSEAVTDPEFQKFLSEKLAPLCGRFKVLAC